MLNIFTRHVQDGVDFFAVQVSGNPRLDGGLLVHPVVVGIDQHVLIGDVVGALKGS